MRDELIEQLRLDLAHERSVNTMLIAKLATTAPQVEQTLESEVNLEGMKSISRRHKTVSEIRARANEILKDRHEKKQ